MRWSQDYRDNAVPRDNAGNELFTSKSKEDYHGYLEWLADYLPTITLLPCPEQEGLVRHTVRMRPDDAMFYLGMHAGIRDAEIDCGIFRGAEDAESVARELRQCADQWPAPLSCPIDAGYRIVLAQVLRSVPDHVERRKVLDTFFALYQEYVHK